MNSIFKNIYIALIIIIVLELIYLFYKLLNLKKELNKLNVEIESIENNLEKIKVQLESIGETKDSWKFFLSLYLLLSVFKMANKDYRKSKKPNKTYLASLAKVCAKNITTIKKIKIV